MIGGPVEEGAEGEGGPEPVGEIGFAFGRVVGVTDCDSDCDQRQMLVTRKKLTAKRVGMRKFN